MRKKIFGVVVMAAIAAAASWNFNQSKNEVVLTDLALANVEALANGELSDGYVWGYVGRKWVGGMGGSMVPDCSGSGHKMCI